MEDKKEILDLATTLGFPIIDIDRVFQAQSDPLALFALRMADHYNVDGHRLVAETILKSIPSLSRNASLRCCDRERAANIGSIGYWVNCPFYFTRAMKNAEYLLT